MTDRVKQCEKINIQGATVKYRLTRREGEITKLITDGLRNKEIADKICVSLYTVEDHLKNIVRKLSVDSRTRILTKLLTL